MAPKYGLWHHYYGCMAPKYDIWHYLWQYCTCTTFNVLMYIDICFVIGPVKSGTTLMVSLLDSHQDLSLFPMEVKFLTHWLESLSIKQANYRELSDFFLNESKIKLMNVNSREESDIMNSGRIDFTGFDYPSLVETMEANARRYDEAEISGLELFRQFMYDIHETLRNLCERGRFKAIVSKEGNHGSKHLEAICDIYPKSKFVVIARYCHSPALSPLFFEKNKKNFDIVEALPYFFVKKVFFY